MRTILGSPLPFVTVSLKLGATEGPQGGRDPRRALLSPLQELLQTRQNVSNARRRGHGSHERLRRTV